MWNLISSNTACLVFSHVQRSWRRSRKKTARDREDRVRSGRTGPYQGESSNARRNAAQTLSKMAVRSERASSNARLAVAGTYVRTSVVDRAAAPPGREVGRRPARRAGRYIAAPLPRSRCGWRRRRERRSPGARARARGGRRVARRGGRGSPWTRTLPHGKGGS